MKKAIFALMFCLTLSPLFAAQPKIQIALLLDTSGSMDGLIDQAKTRLWAIVNDLARAKKREQTPLLEVALYEYGKSSLPQSSGYIAQLLPLTSDLDKVSEALFALRTNGGDEYCGQVIGVATAQLQWSKDPDDYRAIFIAGNEPFDQGSISFRETCPRAKATGIVVNTIFCGNQREGLDTHWKAGADLAGGQFMVIDQNEVVAVAAAPQDAEILKLGQELNTTFVAYGAAGKVAQERQREQDLKAEAASVETAVQRTATKASKVYKPASWDLVDAAESKAVDVDKMGKDDLPEPMKTMTASEKKAYLAKQGEKRKELQQKIAKLQGERAAYLAKTSTAGPKQTLDKAIKEAIAKQLAERKFEQSDDQKAQAQPVN